MGGPRTFCRASSKAFGLFHSVFGSRTAWEERVESEGVWSWVPLQKQTCKMRLCASHHLNLRKLIQFVALCPEGRFFCWLKVKDVPEDKVYMCMGPDVAHFRVDRQRLGPLCFYLCILQPFPQSTFTLHCQTRFLSLHSYLFKRAILRCILQRLSACQLFLKGTIPVSANPSNYLSNLQEKEFFGLSCFCLQSRLWRLSVHAATATDWFAPFGRSVFQRGRRGRLCHDAGWKLDEVTEWKQMETHYSNLLSMVMLAWMCFRLVSQDGFCWGCQRHVLRANHSSNCQRIFLILDPKSSC